MLGGLPTSPTSSVPSLLFSSSVASVLGIDVRNMQSCDGEHVARVVLALNAVRIDRLKVGTVRVSSNC
jgi:hypothetical protein